MSKGYQGERPRIAIKPFYANPRNQGIQNVESLLKLLQNKKNQNK